MNHINEGKPREFICYWDECEGWSIDGAGSSSGMRVIEISAFKSAQARIKELEAQLKEQCDINMQGQERELKLIGQLKIAKQALDLTASYADFERSVFTSIAFPMDTLQQQAKALSKLKGEM